MEIDLYAITPINQASHAGEDIRYSPEMELLEAEMEKLNNPSATTSVNWNNVIETAGLILSQQSKDLLVASYFAVARLQLSGFTGLDEGLRLLKTLAEHYWDNMYPGLTRLRGRKQAIEWWADKCTSWLHKNMHQEQARILVDRLKENIDAFAHFLAGVMDDPPSLFELKNTLGMIPLISEAEEPASSVEETEVVLQQDAVKPESPAQEKILKSQPLARQEAAPERIDTRVMDDSSVRNALQRAIDEIRKAAEFLRSTDLFDAEAIRLVREAASISIAGMPPAENGITNIPDPSENCQDSVRLLRENARWEELFDTAEYYIPIYPYYLDLCSHAALALDHLGRSDLSGLAGQLTSNYVRRVRGIESLSFLDGTPFASGETRDWLNAIAYKAGKHELPDTFGSDNKEHSGASSLTRIVEADRQQAQELKRSASLEEALLFLETKLSGSTSAYESMLRRASLAFVLASANQSHMALVHVDRVLEELDAFHTDAWDPNIALDILAETFRICKSIPNDSCREKAEAILRRIALLSPSRAMILDS